ncbi:MAG: c-type cytochrome [Verrucomicrobia bacterium]|nr:c-type cytochrome [Verrucomicrobiota bacterium]
MSKIWLPFSCAASLLLLAGQPQSLAATATPASELKVPDGFKIELLHSTTVEEGSWICLAIDPKGRLIVSPQDDKEKRPLLRLTLGGDGQIAKTETIKQPVWAAMGLLYAFDSLYVSGNGTNGLGLYRLRDTNGDDQFDSTELLRKFEGGAGEHGSHALALGPDKMLYYMHGNFVSLPKDLASSSPHKNYADDQVLPRAEDGNGFGAGRKPPGGFLLRMDADAKSVEMIASGLRNTYDFAINPEGEMFCFDSDMECDWGTPWYRPTRIYHLVSGGDYGFREGTAKWPKHYHDALPPVVDIGIGSPTGVKFGTGAKFPEKYQRALYAMDWSYGRIVAVHLTPRGSSYTGSFENFVAPKSLRSAGQKSPLNVTDLEIGKDGAMYFTTGGRGTATGLYRVTFAGPEASRAEFAPGASELQAATAARALRHKLETFHGKRDATAVDFAWPHLNSDDRFLRYAARIAIESQPVDQWRERALEEKKINASLTALLALARLGSAADQTPLLESLSRMRDEKLTEAQSLEALRVLEVVFARLGRPSQDVTDEVIAALDPLFPARSEMLNRELCQLLVYLEAPGVVKKSLALLAQAPTQEEQITYIFHLRNLKRGWTMDDRKAYFSWLNRARDPKAHSAETLQWFKDVGRDYSDGASFPKFMANIRKDAVAALSDGERAELATLITGQTVVTKPPSKARTLVKEWKMDDLAPSLPQTSQGRNFESGKQAFNDAQCFACHRFGNDGGSVGPDITAVSSRFTRADVLSSIIEPSKVVSEQYQNITITKKDGDDVTGRLVEDTADKVVLVVNPLAPDSRTEIKKSEIKKREASKISPMPEGLVNTLSKEEILDLLAYIESAGKREHAAFNSK